MVSNIYEQLKAPFPASAISWRPGMTNKNKTPDKKPTKCIALAYIDARDVMNRLDDVFGLRWENRYSHADKKTICEITLTFEDGTSITRANGAGDSDIEAEKGAISDAFKRAAVMFGIGRYLYDLPNVWVDCDEWGHIKNPPSLPAWALPKPPLKSVSISDFSEEEQAFLKETAIDIMGKVKDNNIAGAYELLVKLDGDETLVMRGLVDATTRAKINEYRKTLNNKESLQGS